MKYTEHQLEQAVIKLLEDQNYTHIVGDTIERNPDEVLIKSDLKNFLARRNAADNITASEIEMIVRQLEVLPSSDRYDSNKKILKWVTDGFIFKREQHDQKDLLIQFIDFDNLSNNTFKVVDQLKIEAEETRIPDLVIYINGLPLVVFELKTASREEVDIAEAYDQLAIRYTRGIPELMKYNAFCVISDGVNSKAGTPDSPYDFFYAWKRTLGQAKEVDGIQSLFTMIEGMFNQEHLLDIIHNFIFIPDTSSRNEKILCRYPQYYATRALYNRIIKEQKPQGSGKGGTYFGTTGCGKSYTMLFLARLLMKSTELKNPTVVIITDRTDLDEQVSKQFTKAKEYIGDQIVESVKSRADLRAKVQGRPSGGVFLTTIHKFSEDTDLLTDRTNVICISDEAHRSQTNLKQKITITDDGVKKTYGFAKHLHDSLPNATYVGFTGTPVDATLDVFGEIVDSYTMIESVKDEITVPLVYEGKSAKVLLNNEQLERIEDYYKSCETEGSNEEHIEKSKRESASMNTVLGDDKRLQAIAEDFVTHYEKRLNEGSSVKGKALFVSSDRKIAFKFYKKLMELRPEWAEEKKAITTEGLSKKELDEMMPLPYVNMVMTRNKDDESEFYDLLGDKDYRKKLDGEFKKAQSNFKIAIVVDMWLTGFDVPFLDTIYIDKPLQKHNLIQTISRVNRKFSGKENGLVVDYIGIKKKMNEALKHYNNDQQQSLEDVKQSLIVVRDHLDLLAKFFHKFDEQKYFKGNPLDQLKSLNEAAEFVLVTEESKKRFMDITKRLKSAYDICSGSEELSRKEQDYIHFYFAIRSVIFKLTKGHAPDVREMNNRVKELVKDALESQGVENILSISENDDPDELFSDEYLDSLENIKLPNTKIQMLQKLLQQAIGQLKKVNKVQGVDFSKKLQAVIDRYNDREGNTYTGEEAKIFYEDIAEHMLDLIMSIRKEIDSGNELGIDIEEKAFYDILKLMASKYDFDYPEDKLLLLAKGVKTIVEDKASFPDWNNRADIKSMLKVELIILLDSNDYPPVDRDEVYQEIFEQAENYKKYNK